MKGSQFFGEGGMFMDGYIAHGDCMELMREIPDGSVDLVLCDLPYGVTAAKWDAVIPFDGLWEQYKRILKSDGTVALFGTQPFITDVVASNKKDFRYCWYWEKNHVTGFANCKRRPLSNIEEIAVFKFRGGG